MIKEGELIPQFPHESSFPRSVLKGEVNARVVVGEGRFYLEIGAHIARTEVIMGKPELIRFTEVR